MTHERKYYLEDIPIEQARDALWNALNEVGKIQPLESETIPLAEALGRVTAEPIWARLSSPHYHAAAMDGYAVKAVDTVHATETRPITLASDQIHAVNTGGPLPPDLNAVIMIEHVQMVEDGIVITAPVAPWQHVRMMGEDMVATELVLSANHRIRPVDLGAIAGSGHAQVSVRRKPHAVIIPTGSELVSPGNDPAPGQIIEYNSLILSGQIEESGGQATILPAQPDKLKILQDALKDAIALQPDLILLLSGSSAGSEDFTAAVVGEAGELLVHGIAVRPGHPVIFGMVETIPVIGVPGYPVSATLTGELFIQPLLARWLGQQPPIANRHRVQTTITRKVTSPTGDDDYVRVTVAEVDGNLLATPLARGAGIISSLVRADGLAHIPRFSEGLDMRAQVETILYRSLHEIRQTVLTTGSHDPMLDLLAQFLAAQFPGCHLTSANVGSMGGLVALRRGDTHIAGMHLLDEDTGEYNIPYVERQLKDVPLEIITFAHREQGLIVQKGNPNGIKSRSDLARTQFINRQRGSGTRLLLDYQLKQLGLSANDIAGYEREEYTHMAVAAAVATGAADCGLGVRSAAAALDLDFISVGWERYDFVIPGRQRSHPVVGQLLETLVSEDFRNTLSRQPGYDAKETGKLRFSSL